MATFPTLSPKPDVEGWEETRAYDPTIRAKSEGGYVKTRPRYTRAPEQWKVVYQFLPLSDKTTIKTFETTVLVGADAFTWTNPVTSVAKTVRFLEPVKYTPQGSRLFWKIEFTLQEV
jgi:hypothetical protein